MKSFIKIFIISTFFFSLIVSLPNKLFANNFKENIKKIRAEINRDNLDESMKLLGNIKVSSNDQQDQINLLFGDIYLKINKLTDAENFYQKAFITTNESVELLCFIGLSEVKLRQGKLAKAIDFAEKAIAINSDFIRPKILLANAKTRIGETEEALKILNDLYNNQNDNAEVNLAIAGYYSNFDDTNAAIEILEKYLKSQPTNIKVMNELGNLYWTIGNKNKALKYKSKVLKYYEFNKNKYKAKKIKNWILAVDPNFFKNKNIKGITSKKSEEYEEEEINNYEENKIIPHFEDFDFAANSGGSGFIVGDGKYVITNIHVIESAKRIAVRNGVGKVSNANVYKISKKYDLAILELKKPFPKEFSIKEKDFFDPKVGEDVLILGYPAAGLTFDFPTITEGIISKIFHGEGEGIFLTSATVNPGNSGGPVVNLDGKLIGVIYAGTNVAEVAKSTGIIETAMGFGISSEKIKEIFNYKKTISVQKANYSKAAIYEKMLPHVVNVATLKELEE